MDEVLVGFIVGVVVVVVFWITLPSPLSYSQADLAEMGYGVFVVEPKTGETSFQFSKCEK
jgi:hypothetical protein